MAASRSGLLTLALPSTTLVRQEAPSSRAAAPMPRPVTIPGPAIRSNASQRRKEPLVGMPLEGGTPSLRSAREFRHAFSVAALGHHAVEHGAAWPLERMNRRAPATPRLAGFVPQDVVVERDEDLNRRKGSPDGRIWPPRSSRRCVAGRSSQTACNSCIVLLSASWLDFSMYHRERRPTMAEVVRRIDYYYAPVSGQMPGEAARILILCCHPAGVNLLGFLVFPRAPAAQLDFLPEDSGGFR